MSIVFFVAQDSTKNAFLLGSSNNENRFHYEKRMREALMIRKGSKEKDIEIETYEFPKSEKMNRFYAIGHILPFGVVDVPLEEEDFVMFADLRNTILSGFMKQPDTSEKLELMILSIGGACYGDEVENLDGITKVRI